MNILEVDEAERPQIETRQRGEDNPIEFKCPVCGKWKLGFTIFSVAEFPETVEHFGSEWICDAEFTHIARSMWANPVDEEPQPAIDVEALVTAKVNAILIEKGLIDE